MQGNISAMRKMLDEQRERQERTVLDDDLEKRLLRYIDFRFRQERIVSRRELRESQVRMLEDAARDLRHMRLRLVWNAVVLAVLFAIIVAVMVLSSASPA